MKGKKNRPGKMPLKKGLRNVTTRDYTSDMKTEETATLRDGEEDTESSVVREMSMVPGLGSAISVRAAKAHLSGLLDEVAAGREVVITSDGVPKARLVPMSAGAQRKPFLGTREHLKAMPPWRGGPTADEIVREDRDARGW
jgi:prevent-host-death family protein